MMHLKDEGCLPIADVVGGPRWKKKDERYKAFACPDSCYSSLLFRSISLTWLLQIFNIIFWRSWPAHTGS